MNESDQFGLVHALVASRSHIAYSLSMEPVGNQLPREGGSESTIAHILTIHMVSFLSIPFPHIHLHMHMHNTYMCAHSAK